MYARSLEPDPASSTSLDELKTARILLVDDDETTLAQTERALRKAGARNVWAIPDPCEAVQAALECEADLVLLDLRMAPIDGFEVMARLREIDRPERRLPVLMITGDEAEGTKRRALEAGVADFLHKDYDPAELLLRVRNVLRTQQLYRQVQRQKGWLEETVRIRTRQLFAARREVLERLALAAEFRDDQTGEHTRRVGQLSAQIAQRLGQEANYVESIGAAALLHDLGKIGIPDTLLLKRGPLTVEEYETMKTHTRIGGSILSDCSEPVMRMAQEIALTHHERWDGRGYPNGLRGAEIPLSGRIVAVADAYDAMTNDRPYRRAIGVHEAVTEVLANIGRQFDPDVVDAFVEVIFHTDEKMLADFEVRTASFRLQPPLRFDA